MAIIRARDLWEDPNVIPPALLKNCIAEHRDGIARLDKLEQYYKGEHAILQRDLGGEDKGLPNNKLVANHAKYITDVAVGYVMGNPVKYNGDKIQSLLEVFKKIDIVSHDSEMGKDLSMFGEGRELYFASNDDEPIPKATVIDPRQIFLVVDDTVEYKPMFGVHFYAKKDLDNKIVGYAVNVCTDNKWFRFKVKEITGEGFELIETVEHYFKGVPIVEFWNNEERQGDFEQQLSLIDAYNVLASDRINDKEQFVDAILMLTGGSLGDNLDDQSEAVKLLKRHKIMELPLEGKAEWLTKALNETQIEVLKDSIKSDIHEFSMVPNLTDENFASNASGVAMKYKLFGLEQLAKTKERYFVQGLRERLKLFANFLAVKAAEVDVSDTEIIMTRSLPSNDAETATMIGTLSGMVSNETLISQLSFVKDAVEETTKVEEQKETEVKRNQKAFSMPFPDEDGSEEAVIADEEAE
jgi:SPP1 family phage portal protein